MALWVFGDSFSVTYPYLDNQEYHLWHELLTTNLDLVGQHNYAQWGVSNEYIIDQVLTYRLQFKPGDHIIIQLTSSARQWFFKDHPELANFYVSDIDSFLTKDQCTALQMYVTYLQRTDIDDLRYTLFTAALQLLVQVFNECKILILPGFDKIPGITGTLMDICNGEFISAESRNTWYCNNNIDPRFNHFGKENHELLATQIMQYFQTGKIINLHEGYKKGFL